MGYVFVEGGGGSTLDETEITARASDVLVGKTTIDENGEVVQGSIPNNYTKETNISGEIYGYNSNSRDGEIYIYFKPGAYGSPYNKNSASNSVRRPLFELLDKVLANSTGKRKIAEKLGIRSDKMLSGTTVAGVAGAIPDNTTRTSNGNVVGVSSRYPDVPVRLKQGVVEVSRNTDGVDRFTVCPPRGYYNGNSYVGVPVDEVARALLTNGYSVFKNATFDTSVVLGVASGTNKSFGYKGYNSTIYQGSASNQHRVYEYKGITNDGIKLYVNMREGHTDGDISIAGVIFRNSLDLTNIKRIEVSVKCIDLEINQYSLNNNIIMKLISIISPVSNVSLENSIRYIKDYNIAKYSANVIRTDVEDLDRMLPNTTNGQMQKISIDTSTLRGHCYIGFGISVRGTYKKDRCIGDIAINEIKLFS